MKPTKKDFGYSRLTGWANGDQDGYFAALRAWENRPRNAVPGRKRTREIHPSWNNVLKLFDSTNPQCSQGAFCRWAELNRATFSAMQTKAIPMHIVELVGVWAAPWAAQEKEVENG